MDMTVPATAVRAALQVVTHHRAPVLEIYTEVYNRFMPEEPIRGKKIDGETLKHRWQDIFVQFRLVNIGGQRAVDVNLDIRGGLIGNKSIDELSLIFQRGIPQLAPSQSILLMQLELEDLEEFSETGEKLGFSTKSLEIQMQYDAPKGFVNSLMNLKSLFSGEKQYQKTFIFSPYLIGGALPPAEYL